MPPRKILIADDDVDALRLVGLMLERQGYEIIAAATGSQALQKTIETQPDVVILDVMMPDMDGYEVTARLRNHPATEVIPILLFTAKAGVNDKIAGFQAGADDYLTKPIHPRELTTRIEGLLQRKRRDAEALTYGHIVGFLPSKGGLGTSTLTLNTAIELKRMHEDKSVALVELQEGSGTIAAQMGFANQNRGLPALLAQPLSALTRDSLTREIVSHRSGVRALLSSPRPAGIGPQFSKDYTRTILRYLNAEYDYLLLDLAPRLNDAYLEAIRHCRDIILTVEANRICLDLAQRMIRALEMHGIESQKVRTVLLHRVPASGVVSQHQIEQALNREMIAGIPPVPDLAYDSIENGKPMVEMQPHSLVTRQIRRIVQSIVEEAA
jgi:DNA-binding response OmpR family regulator